MIEVAQVQRRMRGKSRAVHAIATNGWHYVVKPPCIGTRAMINEWLGARLMRMVGVMTADVLPISIPGRIAAETWPDLMTECDLVGVASAYPVDPSKQAVFDFLPDSMMALVANLDHFVGALAVDLWTGKVEPRHTIYYKQGPYWACSIDHKGMFGGSTWDCRSDSSVKNPVATWAYQRVLTEAQIDLWTRQMNGIHESHLRQLFSATPECWLDSTTIAELEGLVDLLLSRRAMVPAMLEELAGTISTRKISRPVATCDNMALSAPCP